MRPHFLTNGHTYQMNSLQCEQKVGCRRKVAMNLCPFTYLKNNTQLKQSGIYFTNTIGTYLMYTPSHGAATPIESCALLEFATAACGRIDWRRTSRLSIVLIFSLKKKQIISECFSQGG